LKTAKKYRVNNKKYTFWTQKEQNQTKQEEYIFTHTHT